jgi:Lon protease-like protein
MDDPDRLLASLPPHFPVFPLTGALLLPGGRLPLNIFEPRYLAMIEDALAAGRMLAMIQPDPNRPVGKSGPQLYRVGCLGRLSSFSETEDGRYLITVTGVIRFEVVEELAMQRGYRRVRGDFSRFAADLAPHAPGQLDREALLDALRAYFERRGFDANWEAIDTMEDAQLVTSLAMVCPFDPVEKQALLESANLVDCCATLHTLLRIDSHDNPEGPDDDLPGRRMAS